MTYFPDYLKSYPNMDSVSPLHISLNRIPYGFRAHRHDFLEFSYVIDGAGAESINDATHEMSAGTFTFVLPYQIHELFTAQGSTLVLYNCMFSMDLLMEAGQQESLFSLIDRSDAPPYFQLTGDQHIQMKRMMEEMHAEYMGNKPWKHTMLQIRLKEILIAFDRARKYNLSMPSESLQGIGSSSSKRTASIWRMIHYIHQNYQEDLTLSDLAVHFSMSISRISEVIKETTGQNFLHFLHDLRIRHACSLLVSTDMTVSEIAMEVGYGSYQTFSRVFRESKGMAPRDYQKLRSVQGMPE